MGRTIVEKRVVEATRARVVYCTEDLCSLQSIVISLTSEKDKQKPEKEKKLELHDHSILYLFLQL